MLTSLSLRNVVLIERLALGFEAGLTTLTGETGAGKSILLDGLGLALGGRAEAGMVRAGAEQAVVSAVFAPPAGHPAWALLAEQGLAAESELVLRRVLGRDGRSRAFVNDQPVGVALLRRLAGLLVEIEGQHDQQVLVDSGSHRGLLDGFGVAPGLLAAVAAGFAAREAAVARLATERAAIAAAEADQEWLVHQVAELNALAPVPEEETELAQGRQAMQVAERQAEALAAAMAELNPRDWRRGGPAAALRGAARTLERLGPAEGGTNPAAPALAALERAADALAEAEAELARLTQSVAPDPRALERLEERLFALRAAARKHGVPVGELAGLALALQARLTALEDAAARIAALNEAADQAERDYRAAADALSAARVAAAARLDQAIGRELKPLKLERARFITAIMKLEGEAAGRFGQDQVRFLLAANPGEPPAPLGRVASGGELSRLMLALRLVLAGASGLPTLIFDEVDAGVGGATAAAVGERLARLAQTVQVLVVTHSPQVAARANRHFRVEKLVQGGRTETRIGLLAPEARREEIARMLAGETITEAARSAADQLLAGA